MSRRSPICPSLEIARMQLGCPTRKGSGLHMRVVLKVLGLIAVGVTLGFLISW